MEGTKRKLTYEEKLTFVKQHLQAVAGSDTCYYADYIPEHIMRNVKKRYNRSLNQTDILGIVDTSILGNGKSGCVFTVEGFYWTESLSKPQYMSYDDIKMVVHMEQPEDDYLFMITHYNLKAHYIRYNSLKKAPLKELLEALQTVPLAKKDMTEDMNISKEEEYAQEREKEESKNITSVLEQQERKSEQRNQEKGYKKYKYMQERMQEVRQIKKNEKVYISYVEFEDKPCVYKIYFGRDVSTIYKQIQQCECSDGLTRIYEVLYYEGNTYILEERLVGEPLSDWIVHRGVLDETEFANICIQLCDALAVLHRHQPPIIHRDIKPSNIMRLQDGRVKIFDYDASRITTGEKSKDTILLGTKGYAPPEQYGGRETGVYSDIYALGMTMCELLTGELPEFRGKETYLPYDGKYQDVIRKCIEYDFEKRYASVEELKRAICLIENDLS